MKVYNWKKHIIIISLLWCRLEWHIEKIPSLSVLRVRIKPLLLSPRQYQGRCAPSSLHRMLDACTKRMRYT